jgi:hypothetical protein
MTMNTFIVPVKFTPVPRAAAPLGRLFAAAFLLLSRAFGRRANHA